MDQLFKMFLSFQTSSQSFTYIPSDSLSHKGNFLKALSTTYRIKTLWIIDFDALHHMIDVYYLFFSYFTLY